MENWDIVVARSIGGRDSFWGVGVSKKILGITASGLNKWGYIML